jgi:electron transfer flavoprotein alpha/beta subunit
MQDNLLVFREEAPRLAAAFATSSELAVAALNAGNQESAEAVRDCLSRGREYDEALRRALVLVSGEPWDHSSVEEAGRIERCRAVLSRELELISKHPAGRR